MQEINHQAFHKEDTLFVKMISKYLTYWPVFLLFFVIVTIGALFYLKYTTPLYAATASLIIKDEKKGNDDAQIIESLNIIKSKKIIENELDILQSRPVIERVINKLYLNAPVYIGNHANSIYAYKSSPVFIQCVNPDSIKSIKDKILISYDAASGMVLLDGKLYCPVNHEVETPYGFLKFVPNPQYLKNTSTEPFYFSIYNTDEIIENLQDNLKVTATNKLSSVINLKYKDTSPELAEDVLNEIIFSYSNISMDEKKEMAMNTLKFIETRLNIVGGELNFIDKKIQQYKANSDAVDISTQGQLFLQNVSTNDQKMSDLNMQLMVINQLEKIIADKENSVGVLPISLGINDPTLNQLMTNLNNAELERERLRKTVAENNPMLVSITDQIAKTKRNLMEVIQNQRNTLETNKTNLSATNSSYNSMLHSIPVKERELLEISRDKNIKSDIYSFLLQKREESELSYASTLSDSKIVNYALSTGKPVSPNKLIILGLAFAAMLGLPISFINAREALNPNILYRQEVESLTSIPIIGEIDFNKSGKQLVIEKGKRNFIGEEFRKIRNALLFMGVNGLHKKILITSGISGEGKSFVAANLAISYALSGKKVVLVDMDLHNSSLCKIFEKRDDHGVSDYLMGKAELKDIIHNIPAYDNLYFISSGIAQDMPSEIIEHVKVNELLNFLSDKFDMTIIDSEPVELVADARMLSEKCDATLYVVRHMYSPKLLLKRFDQNNSITPLTNPGIIFNGVKTRGFIKDNYGHSYGYGYMYGEQELIKREKNKRDVVS
jgi:capsular exopolysaccharide synthesis family protein